MIGKRAGAVVVLAGAAMLAGCAVSLPGDLTHVAAASTRAHVGHVYFIRGFMGWWSEDLDDLATRVRVAGVAADVYSGWQWADLRDQIVAAYGQADGREPIVLVGHSYGSDEILKIARALRDRGQKVDLLITIDPVTPIDVPDNIGLTLNYYQTNGILDYLPWWRGVPLEAEMGAAPGISPGAGKAAALRNMNVRTDRTDLLEPHTTHKSMPHNRKIQNQVLADILAVCPERGR
jgi:pimeloyl-ACP methyl ester carboxylesterase